MVALYIIVGLIVYAFTFRRLLSLMARDHGYRVDGDDLSVYNVPCVAPEIRHYVFAVAWAPLLVIIWPAVALFFSLGHKK